MAQIVFIINDDPEGINVTAAAEPPIPEDISDGGTPAQAVAQLVATVLTTALSAPVEETAPQLEIVGNIDADEDGA